MNILEYLRPGLELSADRIAVRDRNTRYRARELVSRARRLGKTLADLGVSGKAVGVVAGRNADTVVSILAVLFAGAYYVPIDPDAPEGKKAAIFSESRMRVLIGPEGGAPAFDGAYVAYDDLADEECPYPSTDADAPLSVFYTSGSTGKPKGVRKSHAAMIAFVESYAREFGFDAADVVGNQTPFFFDASSKDLYAALRFGMTLEILPAELFAMPPSLIEYMNERRVSVIAWVPTALSVVAQVKTFSYVKPLYLKKVFFVGEVMPAKTLNAWMDALPGAEFVNLYGSSEMAGVCCFYRVTRRLEAGETLPIGKPLAHCRVTLERPDGGAITAPGETGEIVAESPSLADGYESDGERTRARFRERNGVRAFYTGDLARYDADGNLVFVSRSDFQIKHMGRRIELGEIEAAADGLGPVRECACVYDAEKKRISLFCTLLPGGDATPKDIRALLKPLLSAYMLPGRVVILDALPRNANGKIDRNTLSNIP